MKIVEGIIAFFLFSATVSVSALGKSPITTKTTSLKATTPSFSASSTGSNNEMLQQTQLLSLGGSALRTLVREASHRDERESLDVTGILWTEHVNLVVGSKDEAQKFYTHLLGLTPDASKSFHVNLGQQQFHLAAAKDGDSAQRLAGSIGLTVPSLATLRERLRREEAQNARVLLDEPSCLTLSCPWGNVLHLYGVDADEENDTVADALASEKKMVNLHQPAAAYGASRMAVRGKPGIRYLEIACPVNTSRAIAKFYKTIMGCTVYETMTATATSQPTTIVCTGPGVHLVFCESPHLSSEASRAMEGIHICIYVQDFKSLYDRLAARNLIWTNPRFTHLDSCDTWEEARDSRTLRFKDIIDVDTGEKILELEHETRPLRHGQYLKVPKYIPL